MTYIPINFSINQQSDEADELSIISRLHRIVRFLVLDIDIWPTGNIYQQELALTGE